MIPYEIKYNGRDSIQPYQVVVGKTIHFFAHDIFEAIKYVLEKYPYEENTKS